VVFGRGQGLAGLIDRFAGGAEIDRIGGVTNLEPAGLSIAAAIAIAAFAAYVAGRVHQWSRHGGERKTAYCCGYDEASRSLFGAARRDNLGGGQRTDSVDPQ